MMQPLLVALQFLTRLPVATSAVANAQVTGRSVLCYPVVGLLLGLLLAFTAWLSSNLSGSIAAVVVLTVWVWLTGILHLDGLADTADAFAAGGDSERTLSIMQDPRSGPAGVVSIVLVLLIKFAAAHALIGAGNWAALVIAPVLGRTAVVVLFLTTPYVRPQGLGAAAVRHLPRRAAVGAVVATIAAVVFCAGTAGIAALLVALVLFWWVRRKLLRRIGGTTGDGAGAMVEITETGVLLAAAV